MIVQTKIIIDLSAGRCGNSDGGMYDLWHQIVRGKKKDQWTSTLLFELMLPTLWANWSFDLIDRLQLDGRG